MPTKPRGADAGIQYPVVRALEHVIGWSIQLFRILRPERTSALPLQTGAKRAVGGEPFIGESRARDGAHAER